MDKKKIKVLVIAVILVALAGVAYLVLLNYMDKEEQKQAEEAQNAAAATVIFTADTDKIVSLSFEGDEGTLSFSKENGVWVYPDDSAFTMSDAKISTLLSDLSSITYTRELDAEGDLEQFGLDPAQNTIEMTMEDGSTKTIYIGNKNSSNHDLYIQLVESSDVVYMTDMSLDSHFSGVIQDFAAYTEFPEVEPETMTEFDVEKETDPYVLIMTGDDKCSVEDADGNSQLANLNMVGIVQDNISNIIWYQNLEYNCKDFAQYGLDDPQTVLTVKYKVDEEEQEFTLNIGDLDENGNYYCRLNDLNEVHTIRGEYLTDIVDSSASTYWSLTYSFVSIGDLDSLEVTRDGESHTLTREVSKDEDGVETTAWYVDDTEVEEEPFTEFYYACVSVTAQERLDSVPELSDKDIALELTYKLTDGSEKHIIYYNGEDQNFYTVVYEDGTKAAHTNKLYVNTMIDDLEALLETVGADE